MLNVILNNRWNRHVILHSAFSARENRGLILHKRKTYKDWYNENKRAKQDKAKKHPKQQDKRKNKNSSATVA